MIPFFLLLLGFGLIATVDLHALRQHRVGVAPGETPRRVVGWCAVFAAILLQLWSMLAG